VPPALDDRARLSQAEDLLFQALVPEAAVGALYERVLRGLARRDAGRTVCRRHESFAAMCGRFTQMMTWREFVELYRLADAQQQPNPQPNNNVAPTHDVVTVREEDGERTASYRGV
jgi:hypothetical protein